MSTVHNGHAPEHAREQFHPGFDPVHEGAAATGLRCDGPVRVLLVNGAARSDGSWDGAAARTWRLTELARATLHSEAVATEVLDLGAMPDAGTARERWLAAHAIIIVAPAEGDLLEGLREALDGVRAQLADRAYGIVVHGDMAAICRTRGLLSDWLDDLGLVDSDSFGPLNKFVGYYEPDEDGTPAGDDPVEEEEVQNVARAVHKAVTELRAGRLAGVGGTPAPEERV